MNTWLTPRGRALGVLLAVVAGATLLRMFNPATPGIFPPCPFHYLTGLYCPGCGSLRALHALLHGNLMEACAMNPLTFVLLPYLTYGIASELLTASCGYHLPQPVFSGATIRCLGTVIVLFGVVRNVPLYPFKFLAPGAMLHL